MMGIQIPDFLKKWGISERHSVGDKVGSDGATGAVATTECVERVGIAATIPCAVGSLQRTNQDG